MVMEHFSMAQWHDESHISDRSRAQILSLPFCAFKLSCRLISISPREQKKSKIAFSFGSKVSAETSFCNFYFIIILTAHSVPPPNLLSFWLGRQKYFKASNFSTPLFPKTLRMTSLDALKLFIRTLESQSVWPDLSKFRHFGHFANFKGFN